MEFSINPREINNIFAVPASVVDDDLRLAGSAQLKALLWTLRHAKHKNACVEELSAELGIDRADVLDALQFWVDRGVLIRQAEVSQAVGESPVCTPREVRALTVQPPVKPLLSQTQTGTICAFTNTAVAGEATAAVPVAPPTIEMPTHEQVAARSNECAELRELFSEVQQRLGRTIGYEGQSALLMLYDTYGLPAVVIIMAVECAIRQGKTGMKYILSVGKSWADKEIDTVEKAIKYVEDMESSDKLWTRFASLAGISNPKPTSRQRALFSAWSQELKFSLDAIYLAYEEMADHTEKFSMPYMDKVLRSWYAEGLRTVDDIEKAKQQRAQGIRSAAVKPFPKGKEKKADASYDLESHDKKARLSPPTYTKRKKSE